MDTIAAERRFATHARRAARCAFALAAVSAPSYARAQSTPAAASPPAAPSTPATALPPGPAGADPRARESEARALFAQGVALADAERWGEAVAFFQRSRALLERPNTVFNLANGLLRIGRAVEAVRAFEDFLRISDPQRDAALRAQAGSLAETARSSLGTLRIALTPADAEVRIDGVLRAGAGAPREVPVDPGVRSVAVSAPGHEPRVLEVTVAPGGRAELTVALSAATPATAHVQVDAGTPGAVILVDGARAGASSAGVDLPPGRHVLRVEARDHEPYQRVVELSAGQRIRVEATLRRASHSLAANPWLWVAVGAVVVGTTAAVWYTLTPEQAYGGSTNQVLVVGP